MSVATAVYYPYTWPEDPATLRDLLLFFDRVAIIEGGSNPRSADALWCRDQGLFEVVQSDKFLTSDELRLAVRDAEAFPRERTFRFSFGDIELSADRFPTREECGGPSLAEVRAAWNTDPDLVALRKEAGLAVDDPDFVIVRKGKFHYHAPAIDALLDGSRAARSKGGTESFSEQARRAETWLEGAGGFLVSPAVAAALMTSLASTMGRRGNYTPVTDVTGAARLYDSMVAGTSVERLNRDPARDEANLVSPIMPGLDGYSTIEFADARQFLIRIAISAVTLAADTPLEDVLRFRDRNRVELAQFHSLIDQVSGQIRDAACHPLGVPDALGQAWTREFESRLSSLEDARRGMGLRAGPDLLKASFYASAPPLASSYIAHSTSRTVAVTLASGTAVLLATGKKLSEERDAVIHESPVGYLFRAQTGL